MNNPILLDEIMFDIAGMILGGFQTNLNSAFGDTIGWLIGHLILISILVAIVVGIRQRNHMINRSGFTRSNAVDLTVFMLMTLAFYYAYSSIIAFETAASWGIAFTSSLSLRWMITILG